jgi:hypothetical protein
VSDNLVQTVDKKLWKRIFHNFRTFVWITTNFMHYFYEITTVRLGYHKFWARWVPKMLVNAHKMQRMALTF